MHLESANSWWIREKENKMYVGDQNTSERRNSSKVCLQQKWMGQPEATCDARSNTTDNEPPNFVFHYTDQSVMSYIGKYTII